MADNRITVTGHAQRRMAPTVAAWHLTIQVTDPDARVAYERCAARATSIVERLKTAAEIETQRVSVEPAHEYESGVMRQVGHEASTIVTARAPQSRTARRRGPPPARPNHVDRDPRRGLLPARGGADVEHHEPDAGRSARHQG